MRYTLALSVKQPFAERMMKGTKKIEYRTLPCKVRGRVYIYATKKPRTDLKYSGEPLGVIVGTVEVTDCIELGDGSFGWKLANPKRLKRPRKPTRIPTPIWFRPW